ncbi:HAD family hydrolase [Tessaracoccus terricola]
MITLIFDCDGVLAETEQHGHRPAFNQAFREFGLPVYWSEQDYAEKLKIGGGKERMAGDLSTEICTDHGYAGRRGRKTLIERLHERKVALFQQRVQAGELLPRPGIRRLVTAALAKKWTVAIASTATESSVRAVLASTVGEKAAGGCKVFAGDIVAHKKPAPDIYLKVVAELRLDPEQCLVIEDSARGCQAAIGAGLTTVVTPSVYTMGQDFTGAARVLPHLGDPDNPIPETADAGDLAGRCVELTDLRSILRHHGHGHT